MKNVLGLAPALLLAGCAFWRSEESASMPAATADATSTAIPAPATSAGDGAAAGQLPAPATVTTPEVLPGPDASWAARDPKSALRPAEYAGAERKSFYLTMRDGVRIAVDVWLPTGLAPGTRLPTILEQTRHFRSVHARKDPTGPCRPPDKATVDLFVTHGYAYVLVDVRGSGASFGVREAEYSDDEVKDGGEIVDWIVQQDWSDGKVGALGQSYSGTSAELLLRTHRKAVKAVLPAFSGYDFYSEILFPGGMKGNYGKGWGDLVAALDRNATDTVMPQVAGVCPVDGDPFQTQLRAAIVEHARNLSVSQFVSRIVYRDDGYEGQRGDGSSPYRYQDEIDAANTPVYAIVGWYDSGYPVSAIRRLMNSSHPDQQRILIGPWNHGARSFSAPGVHQATPSGFDLASEKLRYFDFRLKGIDAGFSSAPSIRYYTTGADRWRDSDRWPPTESKPATWYFAEGGVLSDQAPENKGTDTRQFDGTADAGKNSRWAAALTSQPVFYPDRAAEDARLITYTSEPLAADLEVTGDPVAHVFVSVDGTDPDSTDADVIVYLEEVTAGGEVNYVTEGLLRASHRKLGKLPYKTPGPVHSSRRVDVLPVVPGYPLRMEVPMFPLSHLFKAGSRIRVALANADRSTFQEHPARPAQWTVHRTAARASSIELPVVTR